MLIVPPGRGSMALSCPADGNSRTAVDDVLSKGRQPAEEAMAQDGSGKWTAQDVPDQHGRTVIITGANLGIGLETAKVLAARGAGVVLAGRDPGRTAAAAEQVSAAATGPKAETAELDLASLESIRAAAADLA